ncbi:MAG: NAD(P)-dependent oxidoreductase [Ignavibacteriales bacterium]|nr:MAG: NAD(P)-dependent oxidoreductase [Ignavibacteriaceae bacterium]MBW7872252.1 NAD(P)-dependent oxidoreductase [Ignavibacteria bacterium]MCZ2144064.1 NAD(P)-dependent oxidoreductase [Ignavibacteriales bacterium]MBV6445601.1 2-hydroxy-3-oxopropionate reductase [Ignavibacteriaceae bacterium]MBZ0197131.1 NAD(P)-dependent oxidoreductase [Ignavibacteriaceae bacterium]
MNEEKIGFIGLGLMGKPMAERFLNAGYSLNIYNRTPGKGEELKNKGATLRNSPFEVAKNSDVVFTMLTNSEALEEVALSENGVLKGLHQGGIHIDCSTVLATTTSKLYEKYKKEGKNFIHAPVLGSTTQATDGVLLIFAGGDKEIIEKIKPLLSRFSKSVRTFDHPSKASNIKIALNSIISGTIGMLSQAMVFLQKTGVDNEVFLDVLAESTLNSSTIQFKGNNILDRNFQARFTLENLLKDVNYMAKSCRANGCKGDVSATLAEIINEAIALGYGQEDYSAVIKAFEATANIEVKRNKK